MDDLGTAGKLREPTQEVLTSDAKSVADQVVAAWEGEVRPVVLLFHPKSGNLAWATTLDKETTQKVLREAAKNERMVVTGR